MTLRTPAYFKYFLGSINLSDNATTRNYNSFANTYIPDLSPPHKVLQPNPYKSPQGYLNVYQSKKLPTSVLTPITQLGGKPVAKIKDPHGISTQGPVICWDWGNPKLCNQQLKALGFTDADLAPATTP